jgi:hypothetical protein
MRCFRRALGQVLIGGSDKVDAISVEEARGGGSNISAVFMARFSITQSQLRIHVSKQARIEFLARGKFFGLFPHELCEIAGYTVFRRRPKYCPFV